jgi:dolichol-phosphate mannosyltransferase
MQNSIDVSVVVSVYNEEACIASSYTEFNKVLSELQETYELIFVNDGSVDDTLSILQTIVERDEHVRLINFSRNFGHESAMLAGIDYARGNAIICMDSDLQHPPVKIPEMIELWKNGFDVVNMVRLERKDATLMNKITSKCFYKFINSISDAKLAENASDFFLISRNVAEVLRKDFRERTRFLRGLIQLVGYNRTTLEYVAQERTAGKSHYSFFKLLKLSFSAISSFSKIPLQLGIFAGIVFGCISLILIIYSLVMWFLNTPVSGYTTLVVFMSAFASVQMFVIGIIGQYMGYIFDEIKGRPIYIVKEVIEKNNSWENIQR